MGICQGGGWIYPWPAGVDPPQLVCAQQPVAQGRDGPPLGSGRGAGLGEAMQCAQQRQSHATLLKVFRILGGYDVMVTFYIR